MKNKDESITKLLARINLAERGWAIVDHWEADECAIGVGRPGTGRLVYISTFKKEDGLYDYECEAPSSGPDVPFRTVSRATNASVVELLEVLAEHLDGEGSAAVAPARGDEADWPVTIVKDRYSGGYSGGAWTAWPLEPRELPAAISEEDVACKRWWTEHRAQPTVPVGVGDTPEDALKALMARVAGRSLPHE